MRLYGDITKIDAEQRMVWGYASTEAVDSDGETIKRSAIEDALVDYMKWANIREMHQPSAVGTTKDAHVDDKGLYIAAKVVDDKAWAKVQAGVYKGFSIGGKVLERDAKQRKTITKVGLHEISLVDRPANPEATFDIWKTAIKESDMSVKAALTADELAKAAELAETEKLAKVEADKLAADELAKTAVVELTVAEVVVEEVDDLVAKALASADAIKAVLEADLAKADAAAAKAAEDAAKAAASAEDANSALAKSDAKVAKLTKGLKDVQAKNEEYAKSVATRFTETDAELAKLRATLVERDAELVKWQAKFEDSPIPPKTAGTHAIAKQTDAGGAGNSEFAALSDEAVTKVLEAMTPEDRAMALIKAAQTLPIMVRNR